MGAERPDVARPRRRVCATPPPGGRTSSPAWESELAASLPVALSSAFRARPGPHARAARRRPPPTAGGGGAFVPIRKSISSRSKPVAREGEIEIEGFERLQLEREPLLVPAGAVLKPVVGDHEGAPLGRVQVVERDRRRLLEAEVLGGEQAAVAGENHACVVDEDRRVEAERRNALGDAGDLLGGMDAGVARVGSERGQRPPDDGDRPGGAARAPSADRLRGGELGGGGALRPALQEPAEARPPRLRPPSADACDVSSLAISTPFAPLAP